MAAAAGLAAAPIAGQAQQTMAQGDLLGLPSDLTMLQDSDPNRRVATSVVNGFVITETDVDQRVALLLAANQRPVSEDSSDGRHRPAGRPAARHRGRAPRI